MESTRTMSEEMVAQMRNQALECLTLLRVHENVIREFKQGTLNCSEYGGILYWLDDEAKAAVETFQNKTGCLVYHVIKNHTEFGTLLTLLYISPYEEEWEQNLNDLKELQQYDNGMSGYTVMSYVVNLTDSDCSEFGSVVIRPNFGGVQRLY